MGRFIKQELPPRGSLAEIKKEVFDTLDEEEQNFIYQLADELRIVLAEDGEIKAAIRLGEQILEADELIALWFVLGSSARAAIKRGLEAQRKIDIGA